MRKLFPLICLLSLQVFGKATPELVGTFTGPDKKPVSCTIKIEYGQSKKDPATLSVLINDEKKTAHDFQGALDQSEFIAKDAIGETALLGHFDGQAFQAEWLDKEKNVKGSFAAIDPAAKKIETTKKISGFVELQGDLKKLDGTAEAATYTVTFQNETNVTLRVDREGSSKTYQGTYKNGEIEARGEGEGEIASATLFSTHLEGGLYKADNPEGYFLANLKKTRGTIPILRVKSAEKAKEVKISLDKEKDAAKKIAAATEKEAKAAKDEIKGVAEKIKAAAEKETEAAKDEIKNVTEKIKAVAEETKDAVTETKPQELNKIPEVQFVSITESDKFLGTFKDKDGKEEKLAVAITYENDNKLVFVMTRTERGDNCDVYNGTLKDGRFDAEELCRDSIPDSIFGSLKDGVLEGILLDDGIVTKTNGFFRATRIKENEK